MKASTFARSAAYATLWAALSGLTWHEAFRIHQARRIDPTGVGLREREISALSRSVAITGGSALGLNRLTGSRLPEKAATAFLSLTLFACAFPAMRFLRQYYGRGFTQL